MSGTDVSFDVDCGPGTYVRALVHDLGRSLDVGATLVSLRRLKSGDFAVEEALDLEETPWERLMESIIPMPSLLPGLVALTVSEGEAWRVKNGQDITLPAGLHVEAAEEVRINQGQKILCRELTGLLIKLLEGNFSAMGIIQQDQ